MVQEFLSPGVYGQEVAPASAPASLSPAICAMVGWTEAGPTNQPIRVQGVEAFTRLFGDINNDGVLALSTRAYFGNGGQDLVVVRVAPSDAVAASVDVLQSVPAATRWTFTAKGEGVWGNDLAILIRGNTNFLDRTTGQYTRYDVLVLKPFAFDPSVLEAAETYEAVQFDNPDASSYFPDVVNDERAPSQLIEVTVGVGGTPEEVLGSDITAEVIGTGTGALVDFTGTFASPPVLDLTVDIRADVAGVVGEVVLTGHAGGSPETVSTTLAQARVKPGSLTISYDSGAVPRSITDDGSGNLTGDVDPGGTIDYDTGDIEFTTSDPVDAAPDILASYIEEARVTDDGLGNLIGDVDAAGVNSIDYETGEFDLKFALAKTPDVGSILADYRSLPASAQFDLASGSDGTAVGRDVVSDPALEASYKGIYALDLFEEPVNLVVPDFEGSELVQRDIVEFCKERQDRFAILGMSDGATRAEALQYVLVTQSSTFDERVAAFYYPNVRFVRQDTDTVETVPVTPFVAGVYARTAENRNIGKAPAGVADGAINAAGVVGPEIDLNQEDRDALYQARINPVYRSLATGYAVWGVRTLSLEPRWRYVNARLLHNFLMFRIRRLLTSSVFENNGPGLWTQVEQTVKGFLESLFEQGFFAGQVASEAFFVRADSTNNNQATLKEGKVFVDVGFAPNTPAEFIIFRLQQPVTTVTTGA